MLFIFSKNKVLNFVFALLFYLFYLMEGNSNMKNSLFGLRVVLIAGAVMLMGATSVLSAPQQALKAAGSEVVKPVQNKALDFTLTNAHWL
jgi:hypothetical protein